jgi:hypothetical protein
VIRRWCIPPEQDASFVAAMEAILDVYARPYDLTHPVICFDECAKELRAHVRVPRHDRAGRKVDPEYERHGMAPIHVWIEPHTGRMGALVTTQRTRYEFADALRAIVEASPQAPTITLVLDNLNTHTYAALYDAFPAAEAARLRRRVHLVKTPKHGSWLNIAELAISVLSRSVLKHQRFASHAVLEAQLAAWITAHNADPHPINWTFAVDTARARMPRVYPVPKNP